MKQNTTPVVFAKKVWRLVRVFYFMLRKNISKCKLLLDLNRMMKRGNKIAGKSEHNLMFHHNSSANIPPPPAGEYEFSCSNSPSTKSNNHPFSLFSFHKKHQYSANKQSEDHDMMALSAAVITAMEMEMEMTFNHSETASPAAVFGRSPVVRQLRVTDSPFPLSRVDDEHSHVDEAAERFISRFYNDLRRQNSN